MPSLAEVGPVFLEKGIFKTLMHFHNFLIISTWKRAEPFILNKKRIPLTQKCYMPSLVEIGSVVLGMIFQI